MKTKELTLGSYVTVKPSGMMIKVEAIHNKKVGYHATTNRLTWVRQDLIEPIPLSSEILEKNGFKKDAFTNLSPDYYFDDENCSIAINLCATCSKHKSIYVQNKKSKFSITIEESRTSMEKKPLYVHQLQQSLDICGIRKAMEL